MVKGIFFLCMVIMWLAMGFSSVKRSDEEFYSIKVPKTFRLDPAFIKIKKTYNLYYKIWFLSSGLTSLFIFYPSKYFSITYLYFCLYILLMPVGQIFVFYKGNQAMKAYKRDKAWSKSTVYIKEVDIRAVNDEKDHISSRMIFMVAGLAVFLPLFMSGLSLTLSKILVLGISLLSLFLGSILYIIIKNRPYKLYSKHEDLNLKVNQDIKYKYLIALSLAVLSQVMINNGLYYLLDFKKANLEVVIFLYLALSSLLVLMIFLGSFMTSHKVRSDLTACDLVDEDLIDGDLSDDEDYWIAGVFYANPHDHNFLVDKKVGIGRTLNFSTKKAKVTAWVTGVLILSILMITSLVGVLNDMFAHTLTIEAENIIIESVGYDDAFKIDEIVSVELLDKIETNFKVNGIGTDLYSRGTYDTKDHGRCRVYIFKEVDLVIKIQTHEDIYMFNHISRAKTLDLYDKLQASINKK